LLFTDIERSMWPPLCATDEATSRPSDTPHIEFVDFGDSGGVLLLAEYDAECDTIRVNARAVERVRSVAGAAEAAAFVACALAHERFHRASPAASEAAANEQVRITLGGEPLRFETYLRGSVRARS
jgi:hypothetical protein